MSEEIPKVKKEVQYTREALANSGFQKADIVNAFLEKDKTYTLAKAREIINKKMRGVC